MSELPSGWATATLGDLGRWSSGGTPSRKNPKYFGGTIPWVKTGDLNDAVLTVTPEFITESGLQDSAAKLFPPGTLLVAMYGATIGKTAVLGIPAATNQACAALLPEGPTSDLIPYVWRFLIGNINELKQAGQGGAQPNISQEILKALQIPLAPLPEQRRIVAKLDSLRARSSRARHELDAIPKLIERYKQAILAKAFSGELTKDWREAKRVSALWPSTTVGQLLEGVVAGKNLRCEERPPTSGELGVIKVSAVTWGRFDHTQAKTLPRHFDPPARSRIGKGDFLISRANTLELVGAVAVVEADPVNLYLSDKVLRLDMAAINKPWMLWFLRSPLGRSAIESGATGNQLSMRNLSQEALKAIELPWPSEIERAEIVRRIEIAYQWLDKIATEHARAAHLLPKLDQAILAKAFRGELVPQNPNDEPASVLLERIKAKQKVDNGAHRRGRRKKS